jgi:hypothetical protein
MVPFNTTRLVHALVKLTPSNEPATPMRAKPFKSSVTSLAEMRIPAALVVPVRFVVR